MEPPEISAKTILALIFEADGPGFETAYYAGGCQDLRRSALYTWISKAIKEGNRRDIDFLEIIVSVVEQLKDDKLI